MLAYRLFQVLGQKNSSVAPEKTPNRDASSSVVRNRQDKLDFLLRRHCVPTFLKSTFGEFFLKAPDFDLKKFLSNAESAYQLILSHAAQGTLPAVENLISADAASALRKMDALQNVKIRISEAAVVNAAFQNPMAHITVQFTSRLQDRSTSWDRIDEWTFKKDLTQDNPVWLLAEVVASH